MELNTVTATGGQCSAILFPIPLADDYDASNAGRVGFHGAALCLDWLHVLAIQSI